MNRSRVRHLAGWSMGFAMTWPLLGYAAETQVRFDSLAQRAMRTGLSPGMSVAVVRGSQIDWKNAYGFADREAGRRASTETQFYIGSTSKALVALAAARLAARGTLALDAPITRILPAAKFAAGVNPDSVTLRRLLTHTHGIAGQGPVSLRVTFTGDYTNDALLTALAEHPPARGGNVFAYSNLGYEIAGIAMAPVTTRGWKAVVENEVLTPLGMSATTAYASKVPADRRAEPYDMGATGVERLAQRKFDDNMGPAGGHFSTAPDLARLLIAEMNAGRIEGRQAIESAVIAATQNKQATQDRAFGPFGRHGWGLGWDLGTYEADTLLQRFGAFEGYRCHVSFMPQRQVGVVVLSNGGQGASAITDALAAALYDQILGRDSVEARLDARLAPIVEAAGRRRESTAADLAKRAARPKTPARPLQFYTGTYVHPHFGTIVLTARDERLIARMGVAECNVEIFDRDKEQFRVDFIGSGWVVSTHSTEGAAHPTSMEMLDVAFTRRD